jgi:hypothetical protein
MEDKEKKFKKSEIILQEVYKTINRQVLSLASSVTSHDLHQSIAKSEEKP